VDFGPLHCGKTSQKILSDASRKPSQGNPMSLATQWVARIFAVSLLMILPGVGGRWLDEKLGTEFLTLLGFGLGLVSGVVSLLVMTKVSPAPRVQVDEEELENRESEQR
jgi:hypothetical protein